MRAAIFVGQDLDLSVEDVTSTPPGARDVVVRIEASGVCHSERQASPRRVSRFRSPNVR